MFDLDYHYLGIYFQTWPMMRRGLMGKPIFPNSINGPFGGGSKPPWGRNKIQQVEEDPQKLGGGEVEVDLQEEKVDPYGVSTIHWRRNGLLGLRVLYTKLFLLQLSILQLVIGCHWIAIAGRFVFFFFGCRFHVSGWD